MEKYLNPYDKEYMRTSMLKHEETFKEQVNELHRLYRIQKTLMRNIETNGPKNNASQPHQKSTIMEIEDNFNERNSTHTCHIDESQIELTLGLGPASYNRTSINKKPETSPLTSDSGRSFSWSSTGSRTSSLTKRTGNNGKEGSGGREAAAARFQSVNKSGIDVEEEQIRQERLKQPSWLFQVLSLNMT